MVFKKLLSAAAIASCLFAASCLKNDSTPDSQITFQDPTLEISAIDHFTDSMGYYNMQYDNRYTGFKYEIIERGDTINGAISSNYPVGLLKYKATLLNGKGIDSTYNQSADSTVSWNFAQQSVIGAWMLTFLNYGASFKIGKGGHILFVTPSAYAYGSSTAYTAIPPNSPLFFDIELKDVRSY